MGTTPLELKIEHGIRPLVTALNKVGYIQTVSSCEGHVDATNGSADKYAKHRYPNVFFELDEEYEREFERLALQIVKVTQPLWSDFITEIEKRYWLGQENNDLKHNWKIEFKPFNPTAQPHEKLRLYRMATKMTADVVEGYASRYKK